MMKTNEEHNSTKPCRACTDFKQWTKSFGKNEKINSNFTSKTPTDVQKSSDNNTEEAPKHCPLDSQKLGKYSWSVLHTIAAYYPDAPTDDQKNEMSQFLTLFTKFYPCQDCSEDFKERLALNPPNTENSSKLSQWLCMMHNQVNMKLGKPQFDCTKINQRWKTGWKDGSCD